jgi:hypothetical protein
MKVQQSLTSRRTEPLSPEDRAFLEGEVAQTHPIGLAGRIGFTLLGAGLAVSLAVGAVLMAGLGASMFGYPISNGAWRDDPLTFYGAAAIGAAVLLWQAISYLNWWLRSRRARETYIQAISTDMTSSVVTVEDHVVVGVKLLQEPEHNAFIFLLHLTNGKTLVLYDYDSFDSENDFPSDTKPTLVPCERISLRTFPNSGRRRWAFSGAPLSLPTPIELALQPEKWPDDESWCRVKWENIERHYGPKQPRQAAASSFS